MSDKHLQRVTKCVSYIGHGSALRRSVLAHHNHFTEKERIVGQRALYLNVFNDHPQPSEVILRVKRPDCSSGLGGLYDVMARLMSIVLEYGAPFAKVGGLLDGTQFAPCGPVLAQALFAFTGIGTNDLRCSRLQVGFNSLAPQTHSRLHKAH